MGMFLSLSGVIGRSQQQVSEALKRYALSTGNGGLEPDAHLKADDSNACFMEEANGNTVISYPGGCIEWDESSEFLSKELQAPVFSMHIHDGDLWMYMLFVNGEKVDQFNPVPDYWDDSLNEAEIKSWKGNADIIVKYIPGLNKRDIEQYLVRWSLEEDRKKAYQGDEFENEDWQMLDFMKKIKLPYPFDEHSKPSIYKFWTASFPLNFGESKIKSDKKPWWKFW